PVTFDLQSLFKSIGQISEFTELILTANLPLSDLKRLTWLSSEQESSHMFVPEQNTATNTTIRLIPMQIRTFNVLIQ
ncbi:unnamed protein product, partial [Adineta steineri]